MTLTFKVPVFEIRKVHSKLLDLVQHDGKKLAEQRMTMREGGGRNTRRIIK